MKIEEFEKGKYTRPIKQGIYFPVRKRHIFEQAVAMSEELNGMGFNELVLNALELWIDRNWSEYTARLKDHE